jgi:hypothetical protein
VVKAPADFISIEVAVGHHVKEVSHHASPDFSGESGAMAAIDTREITGAATTTLLQPECADLGRIVSVEEKPGSRRARA